MIDQGVSALLLSVGPDLPWLIGYQAMPLERLTMLVLPADGEATLVVPALEAPRVVARDEVFSLRAWGETEDPLDIVAGLIGSADTAAIDDRTWSRFLLGLQQRRPAVVFRPATQITGPLRAVKDPGEIDALARAAAAVDRVAGDLQRGDIALIGRTEAEVSADLTRRMLAEGHQRVNFALVAAGESTASPHHEGGDRLIQAGEPVWCDFGGSMLADDGAGYCSDITRCVFTGEPPAEYLELYEVLRRAQSAGLDAGAIGRPAEQVDAAARSIIADAGFGPQFLHRTGHGIGVEEHEDPYIVEGNAAPLVVGNAYSVEPGIYVAGRWGARIEDIVVTSASGPRPLNLVDHALAVVEA
jgi:Xaa-Pro aminopeptidase